MNSWALAASILNGTFDEDYPIMDKTKGRWTEEDDIRELDDFYTEMTESFEDTVISPLESDEYDPLTGNSIGVSTDSISNGWIDNVNFDSIHIDTSELDTVKFTMPDTPTPGIQKDYPRKYREDESIKALQEYISTTYGGHYTSKQNNVQTLDLIESVGDAESFCRSNAIKYLSRYDKKGQAKRDILKALHYSLLLYHFSGQLNETTTRGYETF